MAGAGSTKIVYRAVTISDHPAMIGLLKDEGTVLSKQDSASAVESFLKRNSRFCFAAEVMGTVVGFILVGFDGRSARVYHLVVESSWRRRGIAHELTTRAMAALREEDASGVDVIVFREDPASEFWESEGFRDRDDLAYLPLDDF